MKVAVISDIHGNIEALREILADIERAGADTIVSLGDNIGYGPDPEEVSRLIRSDNIPSVMGNHELGIARPEFLKWFNESARRSLMLTAELISEETRKWLRGLPASLVFQGGLLVHGFPPDSITKYLFEASDPDLELIFAQMDQRVCFVGHTHTLELIAFEDGLIVHSSPGQEKIGLSRQGKYILNAGSVGQPRDGNNNAKYVLWDTEENSLEIRFVPYDIATTAEKIIRLGFPRINATRLW
jgi:predicted phosphodiesterase